MTKKQQDERLEAAWATLSNAKRAIRSIQVLAQELGFDDLTAFNAAFKKRYGVSPVDVRRAARKGRVHFGSLKR